MLNGKESPKEKSDEEYRQRYSFGDKTINIVAINSQNGQLKLQSI